MRPSTLKWIVVIVVIITGQQLAPATDSGDAHKVGDLERVIIYAVQVEAQASQLKSGPGLCLGFGNGLPADEKTVVTELRQSGLRVHPNARCSQMPGALRIAVVSPVTKISATKYKLVIELSDMSINPNEHFATLLRQGTYVVRLERNHKPHLFSYQETCCTKAD